MFAIFARHAAPGAALLFNTGPSYGVSLGTWRGETLYHASLDAPECRALLDASGFHVLHHAVTDPRAGHRTVWLALHRS